MTSFYADRYTALPVVGADADCVCSSAFAVDIIGGAAQLSTLGHETVLDFIELVWLAKVCVVRFR